MVFSVLAGAYLVSSLRAPALLARFGRGVVAAGALLLAAGHGWTAAAVGLADGGVSGLLSTLQQVGNAVGVAGIGLVFFGTSGGGYGPAFALSSLVLAVLLLTVAAGARRLPGRRPVS